MLVATQQHSLVIMYLILKAMGVNEALPLGVFLTYVQLSIQMGNRWIGPI